jgi:hypothetical protein
MNGHMKRLLGAGFGFLLLVASSPFAAAAPSGADAADENLALNRPYTVTSSIVDASYHAPEVNTFPDDGTKLTDGVIGPAAWGSNGPWVGYLRQDERDMVIDLGAEQTVHKLDAWFLQDKAAGIYFPREVEFHISDNGEAWSKVGTVATQTPISESGKIVQDYSVSGLNFAARYVKIVFHTDVWVFLSELQAWGIPGVAEGVKKAKPTPPDHERTKGFPLAGSKEAGGKKAEVLIPNGYYPTPGIGQWHADDFIPYVAYVDPNGNIRDYLFDSFQFDPYGTGPSGGSYGTGSAVKSEWQYYADQLFQTDLQLGALDQAVGKVKAQLPDRHYKAKVVIGVPFPGTISNWGDGLDFNPAQAGGSQSLSNRLAAVDWYVQYVLDKWRKAGYRNLELNGFYWLNESVPFQLTPDEENLIKGAADIVHHSGSYKFDWIPYNTASGFRDSHSMGFDTALMQPNYAFDANSTVDRLQNTAQLARQYGLGIEMEMHWDITRTDSRGQAARDKYMAYLDAAYKYHYENSFLTWYQNTDSLSACAKSTDPSIRAMYDATYRFISHNDHHDD